MRLYSGEFVEIEDLDVAELKKKLELDEKVKAKVKAVA